MNHMQAYIGRLLRRVVAGLLLGGCASLAQAQNIAISHCNGICPAYQSSMAATRANVVVHNLYAAGLSGETGLADWVAYQLSTDAIGVASLLPRFWQPDNLLKNPGNLELIESAASELANISSAASPYGRTESVQDKVERVRLAPLSSFASTPYWPELNNLSNMLPMPSPLRLGAWLRLEQALNELVAQQDNLHVLTGPLFLITQPLSIAEANASFKPVAYFKLVVGKTGIATFVFPADLAQHEHFCAQLGELAQVENMSGLEFFPERDLTESAQLITELGCGSKLSKSSLNNY